MDLRGGITAALTCTALLVLGPSTALAHEDAGTIQQVGPALHKVLGPDVTPLPNGELKVEPAVGRPLITHGPDTREEMLFEPQLGVNDVFLPGAAERNPACATDYYQYVLYAYPASGSSRYASVVDDLRAQIRRDDAVLNNSSVLSGGASADYKVRCDSSGEIVVDSVPVNGTTFSSVVSSVRAAGYTDSHADYTIFFDRTSSTTCGIGSFESDETLSAANLSNTGGDYGMVYQGCWHSRTAMHENGHNMGAVQSGAPNSTGSGAHCNQDYDVMCYSPDGGDRNQGGDILVCSDAVYYDCGFDDYFNSSPSPSGYLSTHWNIGSPLNRFLVFGATPPGSGTSTPPSGDSGTPPASGASGTTSSSGSGSAQHPLSVRRLRLGKKLHGKAADLDGFAYFKVWLPAGNRRLRLHGAPDANLDLFVRRGHLPSTSRFACASDGPGAAEHCALHVPTAATYFVGVLTNAGAGTPFALSAD